MTLTLREDLFFCLTDRCALFLDLKANRYFGLTGVADLAFRRIVAGDALDHELEHALEPLRSRGLLSLATSATLRASPSIAAVETEISASPDSASLASTIMALSLHVGAALELKLLGLRAMVHRRQARKATRSGRTKSRASIEQIVCAHARADRLIGGANRCLLRSFALIDHLARHGHFPELVIGVRTGSFSAHCWVQQGSMALNDELDRVQPYTPIMIL